jgi:predicted DNA-binding antitoxin AbrB/MazE fold protein
MEAKTVSQAIRAVYSEGKLRLLDPVDLSEGQEIELLILSDRERLQAALGDLLMPRSDPVEDFMDEATLMQEVETGFGDDISLSDIIIEERHEGP